MMAEVLDVTDLSRDSSPISLHHLERNEGGLSRYLTASTSGSSCPGLLESLWKSEV